MINKITPEELAIFETLVNPISCTEVLFDNLGSLTEFTENKYSKVRMYQYPMLSYESLFCENSSLTPKENFKVKNGFSAETLAKIAVNIFEFMHSNLEGIDMNLASSFLSDCFDEKDQISFENI